MKHISSKSYALLAALPLAFLAIFYFYPLIKILTVSFTLDETWGFGSLKKLITRGIYLRTLWFTTWQAVVSTILTLLLALPGAYIFARYRFWGKELLRSFTTVPFVLPTVVVAAAFQSLLGPHGLANEILMKWFHLTSPPVALDQTITLVLIAHVFYNYAVVVRIVGGYWSLLETRLTESAKMLGASPGQAFLKVTLPLLSPAIMAAALLVFIFCFSSFGVILSLGGPRFATIEVEIYRQAIHLFNLPMAAALSLLQILFMFAFMWIYTRLQRSQSLALKPESSAVTQKKIESATDWLFLTANVGFMVVFLGLPMISLMIRSVTTESGISLGFYRALFENTTQSVFFVPPADAVFNSLGFALAALLIALTLGVPATLFLAGPSNRVRSVLDPLFMLPLSTSAVTLGFGFIIALDKPPLNLRTSPMLVPLAHTLVAFPFVVRSLLPAMRSIPPKLRETAAMLGAGPWKAWQTVDLPILGRALAVAAVFAFTISLGEFGATVFVARPQTPTMPLAIYRFLGQPGVVNYGQAMAMSSILMLVSAAGFMLIEKFRSEHGGEL
ncbi:MAG: iron ABC transporter permease [Desulfobacterales bacterium]|jgi:thiamine transport system permease protein